MPQTPHVEKHFTGSQTIRDIVIGMSDGLTVPFALAAGLSWAVANSHIVGHRGPGRDRRRVDRNGLGRLPGGQE
jgi:VIT family